LDLVSIVSAVLSAIGAAIAIWQAYKAKTYRDEILRDRRKMALVETIGTARKARDECRKIVTPVGKPVRGLDQQQVFNAIRDCVDRLRDNAHKFQSIRLTGCVTTLEQLLGSYAQTTDEAARYKIADELYKALSDTIGAISEEIDRSV